MHNYALKKHSVFVANDVYNYRKLFPFLKFEFKAKVVTMSLNPSFIFSIKYSILSNNYYYVDCDNPGDNGHVWTGCHL